MSDTNELLFTSDNGISGGGNAFSCSVWDIKSGTVVHSYKNGGICSPNTLCPINNDFIMTSEHLKPVLQLWPINSQEPVGKHAVRLILPGRANALAVSPNGLYCAAGIEEKLYIWQLTTGRLLAITNKHFQAITKVLFTGDSSQIITSGNDGLILIWSLGNLCVSSAVHHHKQNFIITTQLASNTSNQLEPICTLSDHSMPVKDIFICKSSCRLVSVSTDRTLKLYELNSNGQLLLSIVFDVCLTAVLLNQIESHAYVGTANGDIFELSFYDCPRETKESHYVKTNANSFVNGHSKSITCLAMTMDNRILVSGSVDEQIIVWHVNTKQKLRVIPQKGVVTNLCFVIATKNIFNHDFKPTTIIQPLQRSINSEMNDSNDFIPVIHKTDKHLNNIMSFHYDDDTNYQIKSFTSQNDTNLLDEIKKLKVINSKLYQFTLKNLMNNIVNKNEKA